MLTESKNKVLQQMATEIELSRKVLLAENAADVAAYSGADQSMTDRLVIDDKKVDQMIRSLQDVISEQDPTMKTLYRFQHENGMQVENKSVPFGTIMIIYESRPDVTVEAAAIAFKSGNKIILKGGKEAVRSNLHLHQCWLKALASQDIDSSYVRYLNYSRTEIQSFLRTPDTKIDLIIPRGGEKLIQFVKEVAQCPVLVSGRGNNFLYVSEEADLEMAKAIILNGKVTKISACNALDKVLIHKNIDNSFMNSVIEMLVDADVTIVPNPDAAIWEEEFLAMKIVIEKIEDTKAAIDLINTHSGGHSATIVSKNEEEVKQFMTDTDCAAVYHNASTRFTDGGQFGLGAELAISTEKMHHRGPLGLDQLVTNKWFIYGSGQTR